MKQAKIYGTPKTSYKARYVHSVKSYSYQRKGKTVSVPAHKQRYVHKVSRKLGYKETRLKAETGKELYQKVVEYHKKYEEWEKFDVETP